MMNPRTAALLRAVSALALGLLSVLAVGVTPAQAHTELISSTPTNGAALTAPPASVTFVFDEALLPDLVAVSINDAQGNNVAHSNVTPTGDQLSVAWPAGLPAGEYEVAYRVVSDDGHPSTNAIRFSYGKAASSGSTTPVPVNDESADSGSNLLTRVGVVLLLAIASGAVYVLVKRRR